MVKISEMNDVDANDAKRKLNAERRMSESVVKDMDRNIMGQENLGK